MKSSRIALSLLSVAIAGFASPAHAWGQLGHSIIAELAQRHLSPTALANVKALIGETSLASISVWADDYKFTPAGKQTYRWHFVDIDVAHPNYDAAVDCLEKNGKGTCIVKGLPAAITMLKDKSLSKEERVLALKLVVHLAGDVDQPLHASERTADEGGNKLYVTLQAKRSDGSDYTRSSTFHSMWDDSLVDLQAYSWGGYADALDTTPLPTVDAPPYDEAKVAGWANDTHAIGIKAYQWLPPGTPVQNDKDHPVTINNDYPTSAKADLDSQLLKGAARLRAILDDALNQ
ncbi:S1/P1 nuclease [Bradyrhizobium sp. B097]|uniref:S1/P1 nuclease n=1 Tax=Bradyrhizobium sp. B097 TaxID=3140244 RepID=UPI00318435D7